jgi:hypothetical protein
MGHEDYLACSTPLGNGNMDENDEHGSWWRSPFWTWFLHPPAIYLYKILEHVLQKNCLFVFYFYEALFLSWKLVFGFYRVYRVSISCFWFYRGPLLGLWTKYHRDVGSDSIWWYMVVLNLQGDVSWCFYFLIGGETGTPSVSVSALPGRMPWLHPSRRVNPRRQRQQVSRWDRSDRLSLLCGQPARIFLLRCWDDWEYMRIHMPMQTFGTCPGYVCI